MKMKTKLRSEMDKARNVLLKHSNFDYLLQAGSEQNHVLHTRALRLMWSRGLFTLPFYR